VKSINYDAPRYAFSLSLILFPSAPHSVGPSVLYSVYLNVLFLDRRDDEDSELTGSMHMPQCSFKGFMIEIHARPLAHYIMQAHI
jgi:hypothetical protein